MWRLGVVLSIVIVFTVIAQCQGANLQEGWYAEIGNVALYYESPVLGQYSQPGGFPLVPGTYGPFQVTIPEHVWDWSVSVPTSTSGVANGTGITRAQDNHPGDPIYRITGEFQTDYDAGQMRLELITVDYQGSFIDLIWSQSQSGHNLAVFDLWYSVPVGQLVACRVIAVPEPSTFLGLLFPFAISLGLRKVRK